MHRWDTTAQQVSMFMLGKRESADAFLGVNGLEYDLTAELRQ